MANQTDFLRQAYAHARQAGLSDREARIAAAQAALETGYGKSVKGNNYFGIKAGRNYSGPTQTFQTWEEEGGKRVNQSARFRKYSSPVEAFKDWRRVVASKWPDVLTASTFQKAVSALKGGKPGGYATDSRYGAKLNFIERLMQRAGVDKYRPLPDTMPVPSSKAAALRPDNVAAAGPKGQFKVPGETYRAAPSLGTVTRAPLTPNRFASSSQTGAIRPAPALATYRSSSQNSVGGLGRVADAPAAFRQPARPITPTPARSAPVPSPRPSATISRMVSGMDRPVYGPSYIAPKPAAAPPVDRSAVPSNPGQLGGVRMSNPVGLGGPGGLMMPGPTPPPMGQPSVAAAVAAPTPAPKSPAQPVPLSRTIMPAVPPPMAQPAPRPAQPQQRQQPRSLGSGGGNVAFGIKAVASVLGGSAAPGTVAVSGSNPAVSYRALDNGTIEKRNSQFGTVTHLTGGGGSGSVRSSSGGVRTSNALGFSASRNNSGALGGSRSGVSGGTRTSSGGYGQGGQHAYGSGFFTHDK
jgi:hypothetical protein